MSTAKAEKEISQLMKRASARQLSLILRVLRSLLREEAQA